MIGTLSVHPDGYAFFMPDASGIPDVFVPAHARNGALHRDRVRIMVQPSRRRNRRDRSKSDRTEEGVVLEILQRGTTRIVGRYLHWGKQRVVAPDDDRFDQYIHIAAGRELGARDGQSVVAKLDDHDDTAAQLTGEVAVILGERGELATEIEAVLHSYALDENFPDAVETEAKGCAAPASAQDKQREDMTDIPFVTIDGADAKDYDDAVAARIEDDGVRVWIAVADVSAYVRPGSALDDEARARATSAYFPRRVIPMLPHALSSDVCSLRPNQLRYAMVVQCLVTKQAEIRDASFHVATIQSRARLTYAQVHHALNDIGETDEMVAPHASMLRHLERAARCLKQSRIERGCIDLDLPEPHVVLDEDGVPEAIIRAPRYFAHQLIEELMLVANECVASYLTNAQRPVVYRIHPEPAMDGLQTLRHLLEALDIPDRLHPPLHSSMFAEIIRAVEDHPAQRSVHHAVLRSMQQAAYDIKNQGHFGLASECYCHFTSPIRRYPDLVNHRVLKKVILGEGHAGESVDDYANAARHSSIRERVVMEAEREVQRIYSGAFLQHVVGQEFDGVVSHITKHGCYVELKEHLVEGFVGLRSILGDRYRLDRERGCLVGKHDSHRIAIGMELRICVQRVDLEDKLVEFSVVSL